MTMLCKIFGHKYGAPTKVYGNFDWVYNAKICERCDKREALTQADEIIRRKMISYVSNAMNSDRAKLGLHPVLWED